LRADRWQLAIEHKAVDILQPDIMYMGGICRTLEVCRMGAAAGCQSRRMPRTLAW
jgi:L-alanine-DL-glutamate epimerase-like enolase superfamily enzyme